MVQRGRLACGLLCVVVLVMALGCSLVLEPGREQCQNDTECEALVGAGSTCFEGLCSPAMPRQSCTQSADCQQGQDCIANECYAKGERWDCLAAAFAAVADDEVTVDVPVIDASGLTPLAGVQITLCGLTDVECSAADSDVRTDEVGLVRVRVPENFRGYLRAELEGYWPTLYFFAEPSALSAVTLPVVMFSDLVVLAQATYAERPIDPERGLVYGTVRDCAGVEPGEVSFTSRSFEGGSEAFYVIDVPIADLPYTQEGHGSGLVDSVLVGNMALTMTDVATGAELATLSAVVLPGAVTQVQLSGLIPETGLVTP